MADTEEVIEEGGDAPSPEARPQGAPIESRFLFVDVAALRAKQLRRGARVRIPELAAEQPMPAAAPVEGGAPAPRAFKAERAAMDEVRNSLVEWALPEFKVVVDNR